MADDAPTYAVDVLVVCTANQARSPVAELLFRSEAADRLGADHGVVIRSAGVHAEAGAPILATMAVALQRHGLDLDDYQSRPLRADELETSRLVVTMTEDHRHAVSRFVPTVVGRAYTLCEIDRLVSSPRWEPGWDGADNAFEQLRRVRPLVPRPGRPEDIIDPAGRGLHIAVAVLDELVDRIGRISAHLFGPRPEDGSA